MKKVVLVSLLAVGSMAYAAPEEIVTRGPALTFETPAPCDMPVDCNSLSPLARGVCLLKGCGWGSLSAFSLAVCYIGGKALLRKDDNNATILRKASGGVVASAVLAVLAAEAGRCCKNSIVNAVS